MYKGIFFNDFFQCLFKKYVQRYIFYVHPKWFYWACNVTRGKKECEEKDIKVQKLFWSFIFKRVSSPKCCNQPRPSFMSFLYKVHFLFFFLLKEPLLYTPLDELLRIYLFSFSFLFFFPFHFSIFSFFLLILFLFLRSLRCTPCLMCTFL